jgi:hypothetical protein
MKIYEVERICRGCSAKASEVDFPGKEHLCLECRRARGRSHYAQNREYYLHKARARNRQTTLTVKKWILDYLATHPCVDCGNSDIRVLEFDHRDRLEKTAHVSVLVTTGYSLQTVQNEVDKCDVRCANCHSIRTREQRGWWRQTGQTDT